MPNISINRQRFQGFATDLRRRSLYWRSCRFSLPLRLPVLIRRVENRLSQPRPPVPNMARRTPLPSISILAAHAPNNIGGQMAVELKHPGTRQALALESTLRPVNDGERSQGHPCAGPERTGVPLSAGAWANAGEVGRDRASDQAAAAARGLVATGDTSAAGCGPRQLPIALSTAARNPALA
jgi:hypothetical protein